MNYSHYVSATITDNNGQVTEDGSFVHAVNEDLALAAYVYTVDDSIMWEHPVPSGMVVEYINGFYSDEEDIVEMSTLEARSSALTWKDYLKSLDRRLAYRMGELAEGRVAA